MTETMKLPVSSADGVSSAIFATAETELPDDAPVLFIKPALGVRASFYAGFFDALAPHGLRVVTSDWRGHGRSSVRASRRIDFGYRELLELDFPAELAAIDARFPRAPVHLLGHSLGGQLGLLFAAANPGAIQSVMAVASCSIYWRTFGRKPSIGVWAFTRFARWSSALLGIFPGETIGFGGREARTVMRDWAHQAGTGRYEPVGSDIDYETRLARSATRGLILTVEGDSFAPWHAAEHLRQKMPDGLVDHETIALPGAKRAHFDWVRQPDVVVPRLTAFLAGGSG
ncbi:MAG: alpha/beta fold hydrolase [Pseudomonadota bacterium]